MKLHYSMLDVMMASPTEPLELVRRNYILAVMWGALGSIESAPNPDRVDWRRCCDAVNMMETLVDMGYAKDTDGLLLDASKALGDAGERFKDKGLPFRLDGPGLKALRSVMIDYATAINTLPARVMLTAHRRTEQRIEAILKGKNVQGTKVTKI